MRILTLEVVHMFVDLELVDLAARLEDLESPLQLPVHRDYWAGHMVSRHQSARVHKPDEVPIKAAGVETENKNSCQKKQNKENINKLTHLLNLTIQRVFPYWWVIFTS